MKLAPITIQTQNVQQPNFKNRKSRWLRTFENFVFEKPGYTDTKIEDRVYMKPLNKMGKGLMCVLLAGLSYFGGYFTRPMIINKEDNKIVELKDSVKSLNRTIAEKREQAEQYKVNTELLEQMSDKIRVEEGRIHLINDSTYGEFSVTDKGLEQYIKLNSPQKQDEVLNNQRKAYNELAKKSAEGRYYTGAVDLMKKSEEILDKIISGYNSEFARECSKNQIEAYQSMANMSAENGRYSRSEEFMELGDVTMKKLNKIPDYDALMHQLILNGEIPKETMIKF